MRLDDRISAIFNEIDLTRFNDPTADWLFRNFNEALVRARKLEDLYEAFEKAKPNEQV